MGSNILHELVTIQLTYTQIIQRLEAKDARDIRRQLLLINYCQSLKRKTEARQSGSSKRLRRRRHVHKPKIKQRAVGYIVIIAGEKSSRVKIWCGTDVNAMRKGPLAAVFNCLADKIPEESWNALTSSDTCESALQHDIACKVIADHIFQGEITVEDVRGLLERKDQERANSHFQRTDVHERLLKEKPRYSQLHAELVERLQGLLEEKYTHTEDDIPTQARPDDEEEIMKLDAVPTVTAPPTSPDQQLPAPERTDKALSDLRSFSDMLSSDCNEVSLGRDKAPLDRFCTEQSSIGITRHRKDVMDQPQTKLGRNWQHAEQAPTVSDVELSSQHALLEMCCTG
ncbi:hypothetical protein CYMTET_19058 [Cymbomonas tetramitiformis]|uniref:Uncharacterized protein n=1 Tax=Cymbomonas tetramitiformis TaxID=36881 RepID=A0AAE0L5P8_9CHLO|nr:hypothetical protein CYMTET_19058 [Cymbomonas tetramitiformis]